MNRKIAMELGGRVFQIEETALLEIEAYLAALKQRFGQADDAAEIIADIESRMSELFAHKTGMSRPIGPADAREVLAVMGAPSDIGEGTASAQQEAQAPGQKRLYRHPDDQVVAGVCSGLAAYFGTDPVWFRLAFALAVFSFGTGILLYILLILIIPVASSPAERLMMYGEAVTLENMERRLREEGKKVEENLKRNFNTPLSRKLAALLQYFTRFIQLATRTLMFMLLGAFGILLYILMFHKTLISLGGVDFYGIESAEALFRNPAEAGLFLQLLVATCIISLTALLLRMVIPVRKSNIMRRVLRIFGGMSALMILGLVFIGILTAGAYREKAVDNSEEVFPATDTLHVMCNHAETVEQADLYTLNPNDSNKGIYLHNSSLQIIRSKDSLLRIRVNRFSRGRTSDSAQKILSAMPAAFSYEQGRLNLNNAVHLKPGIPFRGQHQKIIITIPENTVIKLDRNAVSMQSHHWEEDEERSEEH